MDDDYELDNVELEMQRVKPYNGNNIYENLREIALQKEHQNDESKKVRPAHKYDASIRVNLTPEKIEYL